MSRALFAGGKTDLSSQSSNVIEYITIENLGNATDFGDLIQRRHGAASVSNASNDRAIIAGGQNFDSPYESYFDRISYVTISSTGNATDFGDLLEDTTNISGCSNATNERGVFAGGAIKPGGHWSRINVIQYRTINSTGNATDFGNLTAALTNIAGTSNATSERGVFAGGAIGNDSDTNVIQYITINSTGNATDFGDLLNEVSAAASCSNATKGRGVFAGGYNLDENSISDIEYINISSTGNSSEFGDLHVSLWSMAATSSGVYERGITGGGQVGSTTPWRNHIQYFTINTLGDAADFGDLTAARRFVCGTSNAYTQRPPPETASHWQGGVSIDSMRYMYTFDRLDTTSVTITELQSGGMELPMFAPVYNTGVFGRHSNNRYDYINISTTGNASLFGNMVTTNVIMTSSFSNGYNQRGILSGS